jgi:hypothetical protein
MQAAELGAGTGLSLEHYPDALSELILTEPDCLGPDRQREFEACGGAW